MNDSKFFLNNLWRWKCGLEEEEYNKKVIDDSMTYDKLRESEWSPQFIEYMHNRLIMGAFRYGKIHATQKPNYKRLQSIRRRLDLYDKTGNDELLVDIANFCMIEFMIGKHPNKHFVSIDDGEHAQK